MTCEFENFAYMAVDGTTKLRIGPSAMIDTGKKLPRITLGHEIWESVNSVDNLDYLRILHEL